MHERQPTSVGPMHERIPARTERLYYRDPYQRTFEARVVSCRESLPTRDGRSAVRLDATAFYPTSGGQPHDVGTLNGIRVADVLIDEQGDLVHVLDRPFDGLQEGFEEGSPVHGEIDWERRFDHMQQHTGQHVLSQAFVQACDAMTVSFHLGEQLSTIDLDRAPLDMDVVRQAERRANEIVLSDVEVVAGFVDEDKIATLPLRKNIPMREGPIRIVEIAGFDWSPCGGTHVSSTGQIGSIKVVRSERRKKHTRIYFVCGWRALSDYEHKHAIVQQLAARFTTAEDQIVVSVERLEAETKALRKELASAQLQMLDIEISEWVAQAEQIGVPANRPQVGFGPMRIVRQVFDRRDSSLLKEAARRLGEHPRTVALLATRQPRPQFVFARSEDLTDQSPTFDMGTLMRAACAVAGGRGGGRPAFAQGGIPEGSDVEQVLDYAARQLRNA